MGITHFVNDISNSPVGSDLLHNGTPLVPKIMFSIHMSNEILCFCYFSNLLSAKECSVNLNS